MLNEEEMSHQKLAKTQRWFQKAPLSPQPHSVQKAQPLPPGCPKPGRLLHLPSLPPAQPRCPSPASWYPGHVHSMPAPRTPSPSPLCSQNPAPEEEPHQSGLISRPKPPCPSLRVESAGRWGHSHPHPSSRAKSRQRQHSPLAICPQPLTWTDPQYRVPPMGQAGEGWDAGIPVKEPRNFLEVVILRTTRMDSQQDDPTCP